MSKTTISRRYIYSVQVDTGKLSTCSRVRKNSNIKEACKQLITTIRSKRVGYRYYIGDTCNQQSLGRSDYKPTRVGGEVCPFFKSTQKKARHGGRGSDSLQVIKHPTSVIAYK